MTATPSLRLSLTVKSNDHFTLIFPTRDSVIFSTGQHKFDMNVLVSTLKIRLIKVWHVLCTYHFTISGTDHLLLHTCKIFFLKMFGVAFLLLINIIASPRHLLILKLCDPFEEAVCRVGVAFSCNDCVVTCLSVPPNIRTLQSNKSAFDL